MCFSEEEHKDRAVLFKDSFGSPEHCAVARKGLCPFLGTLEANDLGQAERVGEPESGVT